MSYSKVLNRCRSFTTLLHQPKTVGQVSHFHRLSISKKYLQISLNKFPITDLERLTATNFTFVRHNSDSKTLGSHSLSIGNDSVDITELNVLELPKVPVEGTTEIVEKVLNALGEETLKSAGLGSLFTPVGLVQNALEFLHVSCGLPWWGAIIAGTTVLRLLVFPLVISSQRHTINMNNNLPVIQTYQRKMSEARINGNHDEFEKISLEFMLFMRKHQLSPLKGMMVLPFVQFPIFLSMFLSLRNMSMLPLESFKYGGLWWFTDITMPDPYFILPVVTVITVGVTLQLGIDLSKFTSAGPGFGKFLKFGIRVLPIVMFPFIMNFPCAVCLYWVSTNFISLGQVMFLKIPSVRKYFNIGEKRNVEQPQPMNKEVFEGLNEQPWKNMQIVKQMKERQRLDHMKFTKDHAAPVESFSYDPKSTGGLKKDN